MQSDISYLIVVPIYKKTEYTDKNLESINDWQHLFIIDNSIANFCRKYEKLGAKVIYPEENQGVSRSWNLGLKEGKDYTFFVSQTINFEKGFLEVVSWLDELVVTKAQPMIDYGLFTQLGWHCNGISQKTVEEIGYFDENFYPSYYEDVDYAYRLKMADLHGKTEGRSIPCITINARPTIIAGALKSGLSVNFPELGKYYAKKWGGNSPNEKLTRPFGEHRLDWWGDRSIEKLRSIYGYK